MRKKAASRWRGNQSSLSGEGCSSEGGELPSAVAGDHSVEEKLFFFFFPTVLVLPELERSLQFQDCLYMSEIVGKF